MLIIKVIKTITPCIFDYLVNYLIFLSLRGIFISESDEQRNFMTDFEVAATRSIGKPRFMLLYF
jgi:hypothetical protein